MSMTALGFAKHILHVDRGQVTWLCFCSEVSLQFSSTVPVWAHWFLLGAWFCLTHPAAIPESLQGSSASVVRLFRLRLCLASKYNPSSEHTWAVTRLTPRATVPTAEPSAPSSCTNFLWKERAALQRPCPGEGPCSPVQGQTKATRGFLQLLDKALSPIRLH